MSLSQVDNASTYDVRVAPDYAADLSVPKFGPWPKRNKKGRSALVHTVYMCCQIDTKL